VNFLFFFFFENFQKKTRVNFLKKLTLDWMTYVGRARGMRRRNLHHQ